MKKLRWNCVEERMDKEKKIIGCEIGVWRGQMSAKLCELLPNLTLVLVDTWKPFPEGHSYYQGSKKISRMSEGQLEEAMIDALSNIAPYKERCQIYRMESTEAAEHFEDGYFDFIFFDGDHSKEGFGRDLKAWFSKIKKGGYAGGHDIDNENTYQDVRGALEEFFGEDMKDVEIDANSTWFYKVK
jgi:hypothetical protein